MNAKEYSESFKRTAMRTLELLAAPCQQLLAIAREEIATLGSLRPAAENYVDACDAAAAFAQERGAHWILRVTKIGPGIAGTIDTILSANKNPAQGRAQVDAYKIQAWRDARAQFAAETQSDADALAAHVLATKGALDKAENELELNASLPRELTLEEALTLGRLKVDLERRGVQVALELLQRANQVASPQLDQVVEAAQHVADKVWAKRRSGTQRDFTKDEVAANAVRTLCKLIEANRRPPELARLAMLRQTCLGPLFISTIGTTAKDFSSADFDAIFVRGSRPRPTHLPAWHARLAAQI